jgi:hypothetical protein
MFYCLQLPVCYVPNIITVIVITIAAITTTTTTVIIIPNITVALLLSTAVI